ncbi:hypothetical protein [Candidatus Solincola tengchongensis]|uniref:hypothetical protein n=1 Tax=Candidatus Solincola tengchongensis TaxID=2900693 RepID=UPI00257FFB04|nr:hypothetical protein [Candidatus Solincola tengchongensis]
MGKRMRVLGMLGAAALLLVFLLVAPAQAANPENVNVSATVAEALRLTVSKNTVNFGGSLLPDGGPGSDGVYTDTLGATVSANRPWRLEVDKTGDLTDGTYTIPSSRLTFTSSSGDSRVTAVQSSNTEFGTDVMVAEGNRGGNINLSVNYRIDIEWEDPPSTYTATHIYTVVGR